MTKKGLFIACFVLLSTTTAKADIYKWVDENGTTHFSDAPHEGAKTVKLPKMKVYTPEESTEAEASTTNAEATKTNQKELVPNTSYILLEISTPPNKATIRDNQGTVPVSVDVEPKLSSTDKVQLYLDGKKIGAPQMNTNFKLDNVYRGEHQLSAEVIDEKGLSKIKSPSVTFYMFRDFVIKNRPNAPHS